MFSDDLISVIEVVINPIKQEEGDIEDVIYETPKITDSEGNNPIVGYQLPIEHKKDLENFIRITYSESDKKAKITI